MKDIEKESGCHNVLAYICSSLHEQFPWHQSFLMVCNHWLHLFPRKCFFQWLHLFLWKWQHRHLGPALNPLYWLQAASLRTKIKEDHPGTPERKKEMCQSLTSVNAQTNGFVSPPHKVYIPKLPKCSQGHFSNCHSAEFHSYQRSTGSLNCKMSQRYLNSSRTGFSDGQILQCFVSKKKFTER